MAVEAAVRLARHGVGADARDGRLGEAGPHASVDGRRRGLGDDERPQRARRRRDDRFVLVDALERRLEAERPERGAHPLEAGLDGARLTQAGGERELASELRADLAQARVRPVAGEQREEPFVVAGELDAGRLGRGAVRLRRTAGAGAAGAAAEVGLDEAGGGEPLEALARDVAVDAVVPARSSAVTP